MSERKATLVAQGSQFSLRVVTGDHEIHPQAVFTVHRALIVAMQNLFGRDDPGHLFVTVIAASHFSMGTPPPRRWWEWFFGTPEPEPGALGVYFDQFQSIYMGGAKPDEWSDEKFLSELEETTVHELVHHWQLVTGRLPAKDDRDHDAAELECEEKVNEILLQIRAVGNGVAKSG